MSTLRKLQIQGVRSFNPREEKSQAIEFFTPVTLIIGQNGCGKTTIIESLKYVITNTFPPGTEKGRYFVHDPKLGSSCEALGMVKLEIEDGKGTLVQCTRRVKCTQLKAKQPKMQSLEGTIRVKGKDGNWKELSSKCVDLQVEMSRHMGVSEAILNYVIFCHQEESCWPLDEPLTVKKKFDAIFSTTSYMNCLKQLDVQDKELGHKVSVEAQSLKYAEANLKIYKDKQREKEQLQIKLAAMEDSEQKFIQEKNALEKELKRIEAIEAKLAAYAADVKGCKVKLEENEKNVAELKDSIKQEFTGDVEELQSTIQDFKMTINKKRKEIAKREHELATKKGEEDNLRKQLSVCTLKEGEFRKSEANNKERLVHIQEIAGQVVSSLRKLKSSEDASMSSSMSTGVMESFIEAYEDSPDSVSCDFIIKAATAATRAKDLELKNVKATLDEEENSIQKSIDKLRATKVSLEKEVEMKKEQLRKNKDVLVSLRDRLNAIEGSNDVLALLDDDESVVTEKIDKIEKSGVIGKCDKEIQSANEEIASLQKSITSVNKRVILLSKDKELTDKIAIFNRMKLQKENERKEIMRRIEDQLSVVLETVPRENIGRALDKRIQDLSGQGKEKSKEKQSKESEKTRYEAELKQVLKELEKKEGILSEWKNQTSRLLVDDGDFNEKYEEIKDELDSAQKECYFGEAAVWLNKKYINQINKKPCCPLCRRNFNDKKEAMNVSKIIEEKVNDLMEGRPAQKENVEKIKDKFQSFVELKPSWEENSLLESQEIPELKKTKAGLQEKIRNLKTTLSEIEESIEVIESDLSIARSIVSDVAKYDQSAGEIKNNEDNIKRVERERDPAAVESTESLLDVQAELESLQGSLSTKRIEKDNKEELKTRKRDELAKYQSDRNSLREQKLKITSEMQNREALETQKRETEESTKSCTESISDLGRKIPDVKAEINEAEKSKQDFSKEKDAKLQVIRNEKLGFDQFTRRISDFQKQTEKFETEKLKFARIQQQISDFKDGLEKLTSDINVIRKEFERLTKEVAESETNERDLADNLRLKNKVEEGKKLRQTLAEKEQHFETVQSGGVGTKKRELCVKYEKVTQKYNESRGRSSETKRSLAAVTRELDETYKNAEEDFLDRFARTTVLSRAQIDCRKYKKVLDHAILTFHKRRMESINRTLKKYWQQVYKGNDVDMIQIKTENESGKEDKKIELTKTRTSYSYRVVMYKKGIELDMRGRCSAGQKVLACILIRIALAEAFSAKCGIIALDEPTTNLDETNITALADCLAQLARRMSANKTFQLVVITHDQPFMDRLLDIDIIENYYRVKRDNNGYSQIIQLAK